MMLADHAQVADGKLFISGGGWSACGSGAIPCAVALIFHVPWQETDKKVSFSLQLVDEDGHGVMQPGAQDGLPVQVNGTFEARRPPTIAPGTEVTVPMAFNIVLALAPNRRYVWVLDVDGRRDDSWQVPFETRQTQGATGR
jgi:Family of unknown function (DUF6941)